MRKCTCEIDKIVAGNCFNTDDIKCCKYVTVELIAIRLLIQIIDNILN